MVRIIPWTLGAFALLALPFATEVAVAQFPPPPAKPPATAPDFGRHDIAPPVVVAPAPSQAAPAAPAGSTWSFGDVLATIVTCLLTLIAGNQTKQTWWPSKAPAPGAAPSLPANITDLLGRFKGADRKAMDEYLLQVVMSGLPGQLLQGVASTVPGVGPTLAQLEPALRNIVEDVLRKRAAQ